MNKKTVYSVLVFGVLVTTTIPNVANAAETGITDRNQEVVTRSIPAWAKIAWKITKKASNALYNISPEVTKSKYGVTITPGTIEFNGKNSVHLLPMIFSQRLRNIL